MNRKQKLNKVERDLFDYKQTGHKRVEPYFIDKIPRWILGIFLANAILAAIGYGTSCIVVALYEGTKTTVPSYPASQAPGSSCSATWNCITNSYCSISSGSVTGYCTCSKEYYYDSTQSTTKCISRLGYNSDCTSTSQCLTTKGLYCSSKKCLCDTTTQFWNTTALECQYLKPVYELCSLNSECSTGLCSYTYTSLSGTYSYKRCICATSSYYYASTASCITKVQQTASCSLTAQCIDFAYCYSTTSRCVCDSLYYYDGSACKSRSTYQQTCSLADQCDVTNQNVRCFTISGVKQCDCDPNLEYWSSTLLRCLPLRLYTENCTSSWTECVKGKGLSCLTPKTSGGSRKVCRCNSTQYYDLVANTCTNLKAYNVTCSSNSECENQLYTICSTTTSKCNCIPNYSYYDTTLSKCQAKKALTVACSTDSDCYDYIYYVCTNNVCSCPSTHYLDSNNQCKWLGRYADYCTANTQCYSGSCDTTNKICNA